MTAVEPDGAGERTERQAAGGSAQQLVAGIRERVATVVVGNEEPLELLLVALLCRGHALLEDVPGVGKTLLARTLAAVLGCRFGRVQLTPDVLPSDITGSSVFNQKTAAFEFRPGPVFTEVLLADEINRATPRTQSALLEAMEERQVSVDGETRALGPLFFLLATENPLELEGTFPLPEAQLDRFLVRIRLGYPSLEDEHRILERFERDPADPLAPVTAPEDLVRFQNLRAEVRVSESIRSYLLDLVRQTRADERFQLGASPRAALSLSRACQGRALLNGRGFVLPDDVKALAVPVLGHRLRLTAAARLHGLEAEGVLNELLAGVGVPVELDTGGMSARP